MENDKIIKNESNEVNQILHCYLKLNSESKKDVFKSSYKRRLDEITHNSEIDAQIKNLENYTVSMNPKVQRDTIVHIRKITTNVDSRAFLALESIKVFSRYFNYIQTSKGSKED